jgi:geranylgeranylglycerol-phosphate geranylgeranyltransferase
MKKVVAFYKLGRPFNAFSGALAVFLGGYVAGTDAWAEVSLAALATVLITAAANAFNDYLDVEIDRINQPHRVLPSGALSRRGALVFSLILTGLSILASVFINPLAFGIAVASSIILYIYSWKLKSTVLMGNATVAFISAMSVVFGGIAAGSVVPTLWLAVIIFVAIMGREVLKTLADYEGDLRQRCRTVATVWGKGPARIIFFFLIWATVWVMSLPALLEVYRPIYAYIVVIGVYPVVIYVLIKVTRFSSGRQLERLSQLMKLDFLIWFVAVILGAAGSS